MGNKYTILTFHIEEGKKFHSGHENFMECLEIKKLNHYGCVYIEIR